MLAWLRRAARFLGLIRAPIAWKETPGEVRAHHALTGEHVGSIILKRGVWHAVADGRDLGSYTRAEHAKMAVESEFDWRAAEPIRDLADD